MTRQKRVRWLTTVYLIAVLAAAGMAAVRLNQSLDMPGLAAIELVLLALPWSIALGIGPLARVGWVGMGAIVVLGVVVNAFLLSRVDRRLVRQVPHAPS
jgi:hypothetical protein